MRLLSCGKLAGPLFCAMLLFRLPAFAQMDFSGEWAPVQDEDDTGDPHVGEFIGIPMSHQGLLRAEEWNASLYTLPEWQCRPHGAMYISRGPSQVQDLERDRSGDAAVDGLSCRVAALHRQPLLHGWAARVLHSMRRTRGEAFRRRSLWARC